MPPANRSRRDRPVREVEAEVARIAAEVFGYEELRPGQAEAMAELVRGHDVLLIMPTGGGKSAVYQVPAVLLHGPTVVISPLIALQQDQVTGLQEHGERTRAHAISSAASAGEREEAFEAVAEGDAEFLFLAPEQLANEETLARVRKLRPSVVAVDEAHCVSSWGHDFRPDYLRLGEFLEALGRPRVVALTATAAPPVRDDIVARLGMRDPKVIVRGYARHNITLDVQRVFSEEEKRRVIVERAAAEPKPGIVYTGTRKDAEEYAAALAELGLSAAAYHGAMRPKDRAEVHRAFMDDELDVLVGTSAFGMGIDKPGTRFVLHAGVPDSLDSYMQEYGRAGRDGGPADAVLYYRPEDLGMRQFFTSGLPKLEDLAQVAFFIDAAQGEIDRARLAEQTQFGPRRLGRLLNLLDEAGTAGSVPERALLALERAEAQQRLEQSRLEMLRGYAETRGCRRQFLLAYFGEDLPEPCGACDTCAGGSARELTADEPDDLPFALQSQVTHAHFGKGLVMSYDSGPEGGTVTVLFEDNGYRTLALEAVRRNDLLGPAG